ncbi:uncharacterized protein PAC_15860 [Phialocephala subalpina]|uniref:2EXR domain-containing protein n=1 Tax=Phialocephala subalpina TaxID=576137 RepID=A0A1L7XLM2_9HELO|nr:uncharacterized protein PAC_15860 [Phialocephala subalpina]
MAPGLSQLYQRLPTELQLKIWDHTLEPRCIKVFYEVSDDRLPQDDQDGTPPLALQVCRTLRAHFLPRYPEFFQGGCNSKLKVRPHVRINSALDTVLVYSVWSSALIYMSSGTSSQDIARIRHIAVSSVLWQTAVFSYGYPEWRKAMSKLTSLESITLVTDQRLPTDGTESPLKQAVEKTLQLMHSENEDWTIPKVRIISTDIVCHGEVDSYYSLDAVDFERGDVKEASIAALTSPNSRGRSWIPTLRQLGGSRRSQRTYVPKPSLFSLWPNTLGVQAQRGSGWGLEDSAIVVPSALVALSLASFFLAR